MNRIEATISTPIADEGTGEVTYNDESNVNVYNEGGQRMSKTEEGTTEKYFYTGGATLYTQDDNGTMLTENILDLSGNIIASKRFDDDDDPETPNEWEDQYYFYHYDIRGSVTAIIDPGGDSVKEYTYDEFGNLTEEGESSFDNEVTFTGSVTDTSTGLQYMNARYYNPNTGRFLTQDTYSGNPYDPWTQHLYTYCGNNPTNFVDPTGHKAEWKKYADLAEFFRQQAMRCDITAREYDSKIVNLAGRLAYYDPSLYITLVENNAENTRLRDLYYSFRDTYNEYYWKYKKKAKNAYDVNQLKEKTEAPIQELMSQNQQQIETNEVGMIQFYDKVTHKGDWDYKREEVRDREVNSAIHGIMNEEYVYVNGEVMTWEEFGNFHYGYMGDIVGFRRWVILFGSEYADSFVGGYNEDNDQIWIGKGIDAQKDIDWDTFWDSRSGY